MDLVCKKITVTGLVQGVGFRPAVAELAEEYGLQGQVKNMGGMVEIIVSGECQAVESFLHRLKCFPVGRIDRVEAENEEIDRCEKKDKCKESYGDVETGRENRKRRTEGFRIAESTAAREQQRFLPVDFPTCDRCREELFDENNRRYRYPFISCTQCGPRYSIQKAVPYDRDSITMSVFPMCPSCEKEYTEKGNIRRHAQTIACHDCGPVLQLLGAGIDAERILNESLKEGERSENKENTELILERAVEALQKEKIAAIKDIGGYHLAFSPFSSNAARRLREFKHRHEKPFAVMFFDLEELREYCEVSPKEEELLLSTARPIVLLKKKKQERTAFAPEVCGNSDRIGAMLPCNPLQLLLLKETGPLVMTSGNRGGEPIIIDDDEMKELMKLGCPDFMLLHNREILTPLDDSIYQVNGNYVQIIRRARGLVPEPIRINRTLTQDIFAAGGDLKAVFALGRGNLVYLSQYFGDLEDARCSKRREEAVVRMEELLEIEPRNTVGDMHPAYVSSRGMTKRIQHHEAHVASVIAEHGLTGKTLGFAFDGTGFGTDGSIWGSEAFIFEAEKVIRVGHLTPVKLLGGDASAKEADKTLFSYRMAAKERRLPTGLETGAETGTQEEWKKEKGFCEKSEFQMEGESSNRMDLQERAWLQNINTVYSSSMGRLFDAVSALLDICHYNSYEGECAILLEQAAHRGREWLEQNPDWNFRRAWKPDSEQSREQITEKAAEQDHEQAAEELLSVKLENAGGIWLADSVKLISDMEVLKENLRSEEKDAWQDILAYAFHHAIAKAFITMAEKLAKEYNTTQIALSGGSFINRILLSEMAEGLKDRGCWVFTNEKVPCGDGGIALGQIFMVC